MFDSVGWSNNRLRSDSFQIFVFGKNMSLTDQAVCWQSIFSRFDIMGFGYLSLSAMTQLLAMSSFAGFAGSGSLTWGSSQQSIQGPPSIAYILSCSLPIKPLILPWTVVGENAFHFQGDASDWRCVQCEAYGTLSPFHNIKLRETLINTHWSRGIMASATDSPLFSCLYQSSKAELNKNYNATLKLIVRLPLSKTSLSSTNWWWHHCCAFLCVLAAPIVAPGRWVKVCRGWVCAALGEWKVHLLSGFTCKINNDINSESLQQLLELALAMWNRFSSMDRLDLS